MTAGLIEGQVLVVEDAPIIAADIAAALEEAGAQVKVAATYESAYELMDSHQLVGAIIDHVSADGRRTALCEELRRRDVPVVIYSGNSSPLPEDRGHLYVPKPATMEHLVQALKSVMHKSFA